jgi:hypothetical protein
MKVKRSRRIIRYARRPAKCPVCGSNKVVRIVFGMPSYELLQEELQGKVALGGCCVCNDDPAWLCVECETRFFKKRKKG